MIYGNCMMTKLLQMIPNLLESEMYNNTTLSVLYNIYRMSYDNRRERERERERVGHSNLIVPLR